MNLVSIIIPNYNGSATIGRCLESVFSSRYDNFEVIVVDDCSNDNSVEIIKRFPCKLIMLEEHAGASKARNAGAISSTGNLLFFTDADCLLKEDTLSRINDAFAETVQDVIVGGTYTREPYDKGFFSLFQSVFINYSETKNAGNPDYIATHAMAMRADVFVKSGGFSERHFPILEDVEFSHRQRRKGYRLIINPDIQVQHMFNYSLFKSIRNAIRKSMYWTMYSIMNKDLFADSGTASMGLKFNVLSYFLCLLFLSFWIFSNKPLFLCLLLPVNFVNIIASKRLMMAFYETRGVLFTLLAVIYYVLFYPLAVGAGAVIGIILFLSKKMIG